MKFLFLRGQVPTDRDPKQIMYDNIESCCDMWTQLAFSMVGPEDYGEIWYWGGHRMQKFASNFVERWIPNLKVAKHDFGADLIMTRGGFPQFDVVLHRHPNAKSIYYGAGKRFCPQSKFKNYNVVLVDSTEQQAIVASKFPNSKSSVFVKPAADNIFYPEVAEKKYDVIFVPNMYSKRKRCEFFLGGVPDSMKVLAVGKIGKAAIKKSHIDYAGWVPRSHLRSMYASAKVAVCPSSGGDSCPRVVPESLACDVPVLVSEDVNVWREKYINEQTGRSSSISGFFDELQDMVYNFKEFEPYKYYKQNLSIDVATQFLKTLIEE